MPANQEPAEAPVTDHPAAAPRGTAEDAMAATRKEYGQWVAAAPIYHGNALIHNPLDPVPASNVELHGYDKGGLVVKTGSKAHEDLRKRVLGGS